jgi:hypothetical protein
MSINPDEERERNRLGGDWARQGLELSWCDEVTLRNAPGIGVIWF